MTVYNAERYLRAAIESVLTQTFSDFEFLIVNDGSKDHSLAVLEEYAGRDQRIVLLSRENRGLPASLNEGLELAHGEFVARMDADDICLPGRFMRQVEFLENHPSCVAVGSAALRIDSDGDEIGMTSERVCRHEELDAMLMSGKVPLMHPTVMMRRSALSAVGGYQSLPICEDYDLWLRLAEIGTLANLNDVLLKYRWLPNSYSHARLESQAQMKRVALADAYSRRGLSGSIPDIKQGRAPSAADFSLKCARLALRSGRIRTARKHGIQALCRGPLRREAWRVTARALLAKEVAADDVGSPVS